MKYICTAVIILSLTLIQADKAHAQTVTGAGSSAAAPIYRSWARAYAKATGTSVEYESVGSSAGMKKIRQQAVGFGHRCLPPRKGTHRKRSDCLAGGHHGDQPYRQSAQSAQRTTAPDG